MNRSINLLGTKSQVPLAPAPRKLRILRLSAVVLLFGISAASISLFFLIAFSPLPTLQKQEQTDLTTLAGYHQNIVKLLLINDRLQTSALLLHKRTNYDQILDRLRSRMPSGLTITAMSMTKDNISVTVTSTSLALLDTFITNLMDAVTAKKDFAQVTLTNLFTESDTHTFNLTISVVML
ncbi:MAG TPA: PilN domain-containing protein [Methylomirabilota bacterium]|nr:PilN domain-containing protein [Methylomirabilota bacterium]